MQTQWIYLHHMFCISGSRKIAEEVWKNCENWDTRKITEKIFPRKSCINKTGKMVIYKKVGKLHGVSLLDKTFRQLIIIGRRRITHFQGWVPLLFIQCKVPWNHIHAENKNQSTKLYTYVYTYLTYTCIHTLVYVCVLNNDNQKEMAINVRVRTCRLEEGQLGGAAEKKIKGRVL